MSSSKDKGKKGRKIGRNREKCGRYRMLGRREANKARRMRRDALRAGVVIQATGLDAVRTEIGHRVPRKHRDRELIAA